MEKGRRQPARLNLQGKRGRSTFARRGRPRARNVDSRPTRARRAEGSELARGVVREGAALGDDGVAAGQALLRVFLPVMILLLKLPDACCFEQMQISD